MPAILIVKLGSTFPALAERRGDFDDWIQAGMALPRSACARVSPCRGEALPDPLAHAGVVLTGSHAMVTDRTGWSERTAAWLRDVVATATPLLAICYGHQLLAHAFGGRVGPNPHGRQFGTSLAHLAPPATRDALFARLPNPLAVQVCHTQSVLRLPPGAVVLVRHRHDPHHAFRLGHRAWAVQFHPEFDPSSMWEYVRHFWMELRSQGEDPDRLLRTLSATPASASLLRRFAAIALGTR